MGSIKRQVREELEQEFEQKLNQKDEECDEIVHKKVLKAVEQVSLLHNLVSHNILILPTDGSDSNTPIS